MAKSLSFYNLTGGLNTVQDLFTMNSTPNRTESPDMKNIEYSNLGGIKTMEGNLQIGQQFFDLNNPTVSIRVTCGYDYEKDNFNYHIVTLLDGRCLLFNEKENKFESFYQFPTRTARHSITKFGYGIVITNGVDDLLYYEYGRSKELSGTVSGEANQYVLTGTDTEFTKELHMGDVIIINDIQYEVTKITDDTHINVTTGNKFDLPIQVTISNETFNQSNISIIDAQLINTTDDVTMEPRPIRGLAINSYKGRLWIGGNDNVLYASEIGLVNGWDIKYGAVAFDGFNEDSSDITGLGIWNKYLVCHKVNGTYLIDGNDSDTSNWSVEPYSESTALSQQSFVSNDIGYFIFDSNNIGIYPLLSRSLYNTTYRGQELSTKINSLFRYIDTTKLNEIFIVYEPLKQYILFYMNFLDGNNYSNKCYIYNTLTKSWLYRELPQKVTIAYSVNNEIYIGTNDGKVLKEFIGTTFNGEAIDFYWTSPSYVWSGGTNKATTKEFRVKLNQISSNNFYIESILNGDRITTRKRKITNGNENGINLIWDIGYNKEDFNYINTPVLQDVYHYKGSDNNDYYSRTDAINNIDVKMYYDEKLTQYAGLNNELYYLIDSNEYNYSEIHYTTFPVYGWTGKDLSYKCYKSTADPNILIWVLPDDNTKGLRNTKKETITKQTFWAYQVSDPNNDSYDTSLVLVPSPNWGYVGKNSKGAPNWDGRWVYNLETGDMFGIYWYVYMPHYKTWKWVTKRFRFRIPSRDEFQTVTQTIWNGRNNSDDAETVSITNVTNASLVCDGVTYNRFEEKDYGNNNSIPKYSLSLDLVVGDNIYTDKEATEVYSTVKSFEDNVITLNNEEEEKLYRYEQEDGLTSIPNYKLKQNVILTYNEIIVTYVSYPYPEVNLSETLTDTVWADGIGQCIQLGIEEIKSTIGNLWEKIGYLTKRFILSNQYFETIQYRFYGDTIDDSMDISGFEVDGIQLTEVPY